LVVCRPQLLDCQSLPVNRTLHDGTDVIIRSLRYDDVDAFVAAFKRDAAAGNGYGFDEVSDMQFFIDNYVNGCYNFVVELVRSGDAVAYGNVGPTPFTRSAEPVIIDSGNLTISPQYRRRQWQLSIGMFLTQIFDVNFTGIRGYQGDTAVTNLAAYFGPLKANYTVNGVLPRAIYFQERGWVDVLLFFRHHPRHVATTYSKL